jgi:hypothetical membrane protein
MRDINKRTNSDRSRRILAIGSILGPIILMVTVVVLGFIRPDYSHSMQLMSELGEVGVPNGIFMKLASYHSLIKINIF